MKLTHPDGGQPVETDNPEAYLSQGWVEVEAPAKKSTTDETKAK